METVALQLMLSCNYASIVSFVDAPNLYIVDFEMLRTAEAAGIAERTSACWTSLFQLVVHEDTVASAHTDTEPVWIGKAEELTLVCPFEYLDFFAVGIVLP